MSSERGARPIRQGWLAVHRRDGVPSRRWICFPHAGGGANSFRGWCRSLRDRDELLAVRYPAREARMSEPPPSCLRAVADEVAAAIVALPRCPTIFYGHSMGSLLAFEVARRMPSGWPLMQLGIAAHRAPHLSDSTGAELSSLPDAALVERLRTLGGTPTEVLDDPALLALCMPVIRADFAMCERYQLLPSPPLTVPILAFVGDRDPVVAPTKVTGWSKHTTAGFTLHVIAGDHFFTYEQGATIQRFFVDPLCVGAA